MDNASPHGSKQTIDFLSSLRLISASHPLYSPDLAPSDFYLFGKVKQLLVGKKFESTDEILHPIAQIVHSARDVNWTQYLKNGKGDWNDASRRTESMWSEEILQMSSVFLYL
jgi:hypothetical protein